MRRSSSYLPSYMAIVCSEGRPLYCWIMRFNFATVSPAYNSYSFAFCSKSLTRTSTPPLRARTRFIVISFVTLLSASVLPSSSYLPQQMSRCWSAGTPSLSRILSFRYSTESVCSTFSVIVFPVKVLTNSYILYFDYIII